MCEHPTTEAEALALDSEARLAPVGRRVRVACHSCGQVYNAGQGHFGSDYCLVQTRLRTHGDNGYEVVTTALVRLLRDSYVHLVRDWVGAAFRPSAFRQTRAELRPLAPRWAASVTRATRRMVRTRRVALLRLLGREELREARAYIAASRETEWLLRAWRPIKHASTKEPRLLAGRVLHAWQAVDPWCKPGQWQELNSALALLARSEAWAAGGAAAYAVQPPLPRRKE